MAHLFLEIFSSEGALGINQPLPETLACTTDFSLLFSDCDRLGVGDDKT